MAMLPVQAPSERGPITEIRPRLGGTARRGLAGRSDESLVAVAKEGDERAFEILYERHSPAILRYCRSLLRSTQEAEDVKQEVFVLAISALRRGAEPDAFRPWLYRVAHNACMSHLRIRRPVLVADNGVLVGPAGAAEPVDGHREELRQLLDDIGKLPDVQRGALLLREMDGFSYEQVGEVLGLSLSTVRASIFRARRTLQGLAEARDADCEEIQSELCRLADRRGRRGRHITTHLHVCAICRDFRDGLRRRPAVLGGVPPAAPFGSGGLLLALKGKLLGGAAAGGAGTALATGGGGAGVAKFAAVAASSIALLAGAGVEADRVIDHSRRETAAAKGHVTTAPTVDRAAARTVTAAGAGAAAAAVTAAGSDAALREGRVGGTPSGGATRTTAGGAHAGANRSSGAATATRGHGAPRATGPAAAAPSASGSVPGARADRRQAASPRSGERDANRNRGAERHHGSTGRDDEDSPRTGGATDTTSGAKGSGHERSTEPADDGAPRQDSSGTGGATPPTTPDDTEAAAPPHSSGPSAPTPTTPTAPAPAPAPSAGGTGGGSNAPAPAPTPAPTPAPPTDPAAPPVPPADPGPTGTTSTTTPPADTGTAAVVPAP
jgi:RNA polymerase sigma factor (sigma-70 family)